MRQHGAIELAWNGGEHTFRLGLAEIEELERECEMSVFLLYSAVSDKVPFAHLKHYSAVIRLGLVGGGMAPVEARAEVRRNVDERPLVESVVLAQVILRAALERVHSKEMETAPGEAEAPKSEDPSGSTSAPSEQTPLSSASRT
ncbi:gene transfer agent family protein [Chelativorans sp.]|uniref:gene transfer agent family protein n=1 Tax=Chelativorans sp. TaxID=2203393 RepID=UPI002810D0F5|nr:gene transfer agent family protein [Chelativorans sp.]